MMEKQLHDVKHDYLRYANCWEDADLLIEGLGIQQGDRVLSIGSAGDNSFSLLTKDPDIVVAVDINSVQLKLIELKKAAFLELDYDTFLKFLGFRECDDRKVIYDSVKKHLSQEVCDYWESRLEDIEAGIIHQGKFEKYFKLFRAKILSYIHSSKTIYELFTNKDRVQQEIFYNTKWNTLRWRLLFKVFFSKLLLGKIGRDPAFLKEVKVPVSNFLFNQATVHLRSTECQENYFLHFILTGVFVQQRPHYAREDNFHLIKDRIKRLKTEHGYVEQALIKYPEFNKFNLSNIFEYMDINSFKKVAQTLVAKSSHNSTYVYWNLMVPRRMSKYIEGLLYNNDLSHALAEKDKCFFYSRIIIDKKI